MSEAAQETKCRVIAEWLGFRFMEDPRFTLNEGQWHAPECACQAKAAEDKCACVDNCYLSDDDNPPNFYTSEAASALILEKLPEPMLMRDCDTWKCAPKDYSFTMDTKRLHAIADAGYALALREREGR